MQKSCTSSLQVMIVIPHTSRNILNTGVGHEQKCHKNYFWPLFGPWQVHYNDYLEGEGATAVSLTCQEVRLKSSIAILVLGSCGSVMCTSPAFAETASGFILTFAIVLFIPIICGIHHFVTFIFLMSLPFNLFKS